MSMRITNGMMIDNVLRDLNSGMVRQSKYSSQLASNRKMVNLSDNPVGLLNSLNARQQLRQISQYRSNLTTMRKWTQQAESSVMDMNEMIKNMNELTIEAAGTTNPQDKKNIATQIKQLREHLIDTLNTSIGDKYIFGGFNTTHKPFSVDDSGKVLYNGIDLAATGGKTYAPIDTTTLPATVVPDSMQWGGNIEVIDQYAVSDATDADGPKLKFTATSGKEITVLVSDTILSRKAELDVNGNPTGVWNNTMDLSTYGLGNVTWQDNDPSDTSPVTPADIVSVLDGHKVGSDIYDKTTEVYIDPEKPLDPGGLTSLDWEGPITRNGKFYIQADGAQLTITDANGGKIAAVTLTSPAHDTGIDLTEYGLGTVSWDNTQAPALTMEEIAAQVSGVGYITTKIGEESAQNIKMEIGYELTMNATFTGIDIVGLGENNMFKVIDDLIADLDAGAPNEKLTLYLGKLTDVQDRLLTAVVDLGARSNRLTTMENRYSLDFINAEAVRTDIEDIDQAYTIMQMKFAESIYQQALAAGAKIIQPTLMDFLR